MVGAPDDVPMTSLLARLIGAFVRSHVREPARCVFFIAKMNQEDLTTVGEFMATGKVTPVIDKRYRFSEAREAFRYTAEGHARGKLVIIPDI